MSIKQKVFSILALLLMMAVTGATAQTTYKTTLKDGTEDAARWSAAPNPARGGQSVTIKYNGTKKVKRVTTTMAALRPLAEATTSDLGKIAGADGYIYGTKAVAEAAGTQAVAMIAYVGSETDNATYKHGLAIALSDEGTMNWSDAKSACEAKNTSTPVANASWLLPSQNQWKTMFSANGGNEESFAGLNTALAAAGGDSSKLNSDILYTDFYWSSTENGSSNAWYYVFRFGYWNYSSKGNHYYVRACLVF